MTVASEITRLQGAKSDIRQAIIDKGVDVGASLTLDQYADCIIAIPTGPKTGYVDFLLVGGGGNGGPGYGSGAGGGGGGFIEMCGRPIEDNVLDVKVGGVESDSCFAGKVACGGGRGGYHYWSSTHVSGCNGGSGGGGPANNGTAGQGTPGQGNNGGAPLGGGGGAGGVGCNGTQYCGGAGGPGKCSCISGSCQWYSAGGGGSGQSGKGAGGVGGGGEGGCDASTYGSGGGGGAGLYSISTGCGCQGVVIIRYKTDGSCGICNTSTGGCKYTCGQYTIHCFTDTSQTQYFIPHYK